MNERAMAETPDWRDEIFGVLQAAEIRQVGQVPDAGHARLIELCPRRPRDPRSAADDRRRRGGAGRQRLARRSARGSVDPAERCRQLRQQTCRFPLAMLVAMRGEWAEFNPWQVPMGSRTRAAFELCNVLVYRVERPEEAAETVAAALEIAFNGDLAAAVLLSQRLIGTKWWVK